MPLTIFRRGKVWHYRGTVNRHRLRGSTRTTDKERAQRITAELEAREWKRHLDGPAAVLRFSDAAALYVKARKPTRFLRPLLIYWKETPVSQITAGAIRQAALTIYPDASAATRNRAVITVTAAVINHAAESELCQRIRVKRFPTERKEKRPATWNWVQEFMSNSSPHLAALACFMFLTGARVSEALSLTWNCVEFSSCRAKLKQTKTGEERWTHLPTALIAALANIPGPHEGRVFGYSSRQSCDRSWRRACVRAGIEVLSFHSCRHGFATELLRRGVTVPDVAMLGGWRSAAQVLATYGHSLNDLTLTDRLVSTNETQPKRAKPKAIGE
jgi:integrase